MTEIAELKKSITPTQSFPIKRLTQLQTQTEKQAGIISKQKRVLEMIAR